MGKEKEARELVKQVFNTPANLIPDNKNKILKVQLHHLSTRRDDAAVEKMLEELNKTEYCFPGTELQLVYEFI